MLVGNLALARDASQHVAGSRLPAMLQDLLVEKHEDEEIVLQLLYTFQSFMFHDEVRDAVLQSAEALQLAPCIMRFCRSRNPAVVNQASSTLEAIAEYTTDLIVANPEGGAPGWAEQIKAFRFEQHNGEWCHYITRELSGSAGMSPSSMSMPQGSGEEDEEEFAFHWAGGDAADAADLANRDWGHNEAMKDSFGGFMHSSRYVT